MMGLTIDSLKKERTYIKMKKFIDEFKSFIAKGNVLDMAVAVVMGAAFNNIINSLVKDIIMPLITLLTGRVSVSDWKWVISPATEDAAENALLYGNFIQMIINFFIIAFSIFVTLKVVLAFRNKFEKKKEEEVKKEAPQGPTDNELLIEIRDLLKEQNK